MTFQAKLIMSDKIKPLSSRTLLSPKEVALQLGVSPVTVRYWAQEKKIPFTTTPGGHRRFTQSDVDKFVKQYKYSLNLTLQVI